MHGRGFSSLEITTKSYGRSVCGEGAYQVVTRLSSSELSTVARTYLALAIHLCQEHTSHAPASGPLHLLCPWPEA